MKLWLVLTTEWTNLLLKPKWITLGRGGLLPILIGAAPGGWEPEDDITPRDGLSPPALLICGVGSGTCEGAETKPLAKLSIFVLEGISFLEMKQIPNSWNCDEHAWFLHIVENQSCSIPYSHSYSTKYWMFPRRGSIFITPFLKSDDI